MKTTLVLFSVLTVLLIVSCQSATPITAPTSVAPPATETPTVPPTVTATEEPVATSALDAFLLTKAAITPIPTFKVIVPANACWINSEVNVIAGQRVSISSRGIVNTYGGREGSNSDPNGQANGMCGGTKCPVIGVGYGSLIGRVGDGKAFFVGTSLEFVADRDGQLYFTVNDWECDDNTGTFNLVITTE